MLYCLSGSLMVSGWGKHGGLFNALLGRRRECFTCNRVSMDLSPRSVKILGILRFREGWKWILQVLAEKAGKTLYYYSTK